MTHLPNMVQPFAGTPEHRPFQAYSPLQCHFLTRLHRLEAMRQGFLMDEDGDPALAKTVSYALYATWRDCLDHDLAGEAREILGLGPAEEPVAVPETKAPAKRPSKARPRRRAA